MKKKISPGVLLIAFALSLFMSMSLKKLQAQVTEPVRAYPGGATGTTATGGTIGPSSTTSAGTPMGATSGSSATIPTTAADTNVRVQSNPTATGGTIGPSPTTATGGTIGATTIITPTIDQATREQGFRPGLEIPPANPNDCVSVAGRGQMCGAEALNWCRQFPLTDNCSIINSNATILR